MASYNKKRRHFEDEENNVRVEDQMCCGVSYLRNLLYIYNIILFFSGIALLSIGVWVLLDQFSYISYFLSPWYKGLTCLTLSCGVLVILVSFIGCSGTRLSNSGCLGLFATLLMLILLGELSLGILAYFYEFMIGGEMTKALNNTIARGYGVDIISTKALDELQRQMKCCGANSFKDWQGSAWISNYTLLKSNPLTNIIRYKTPDSCCITEIEECGERLHPSNIYVDGCKDSLGQLVKEHLKLMGALGLGLSCLQIFGIVFSCCLIRQLQNWTSKQKEVLWKS